VTTTGTVRFAPRPPEDADGLAPADHAGPDAERPRTGFVLLPRAVLHASGLSRDARLLYAVLLSYAWQQSSCFPSHRRLQADLGCGVNQVTKYLRELEAAGLMERRELPGGAVEYRLTAKGAALSRVVHEIEAWVAAWDDAPDNPREEAPHARPER
jgi:hypothetical protein